MKVLITYLSQTGNTEKIANAICQEASQGNEAQIKKLDEVDPGSVSEFDYVFVGSPIHAGTIAKEVDDFLQKIPESNEVKLAGFITHAAKAYPKQSLDEMSVSFENNCKEKGFEYKGCFNCQGYLADFMHDAVQKMQKADDEAWADNVKQMAGHPNSDDESQAREFVKRTLS